jgi:hypothetical protein
MDMPNGYGLWVCPFLPRSFFVPTSISVWTNYPCPVINSPSGAKSQAGDHGLAAVVVACIRHQCQSPSQTQHRPQPATTTAPEFWGSKANDADGGEMADGELRHKLSPVDSWDILPHRRCTSPSLAWLADAYSVLVCTILFSVAVSASLAPRVYFTITVSHV